MKNPMRARTIATGGLAIAALVAVSGPATGDGLRFSDHPLTSSAGPTADEANPITFGNAAIQQRSIADRKDPARRGEPNSGL